MEGVGVSLGEGREGVGVAPGEGRERRQEGEQREGEEYVSGAQLKQGERNIFSAG